MRLRRIVLNGVTVALGSGGMEFRTYGKFRSWAYNAFNLPGGRKEYVIRTGGGDSSVSNATVLPAVGKDAFAAPGRIILASRCNVYVFGLEYILPPPPPPGACCALM
jgi:hypothetical protein